MKSTLSFVAALLGAGLTGATPVAHGGLIYDVELEEAAVVPWKADHVVRDLGVQYVDIAQGMYSILDLESISLTTKHSMCN